MRTGQCPKCGKPLSLPEGVAQVTCQQCGTRLKVNVTASPPPPSDGGKIWFVVFRGEKRGPMSIGELELLAQASQINAETPVWKQGMSGWVRAAESPELRSLFPAQPSPPPSSPSIPLPGAQETGGQPPPPSDAGKIWYAVINGEQIGPFSISELAAVAQGFQATAYGLWREFLAGFHQRAIPRRLTSQINADTQVWRQGMPSWVRAAEIPEFRSFVPPEPPPPLAQLSSQGPPPLPAALDESTAHVIRRSAWLALISAGLLGVAAPMKWQTVSLRSGPFEVTAGVTASFLLLNAVAIACFGVAQLRAKSWAVAAKLAKFILCFAGSALGVAVAASSSIQPHIARGPVPDFNLGPGWFLALVGGMVGVLSQFSFLLRILLRRDGRGH